MKNMKKLFALVLALALCFSLAIPAMAADTKDHTLTVNGKTTGRTLDVYRIFKADMSVNADGDMVMSNVEWGDSIVDTDHDLSNEVLTALHNLPAITSGSNTYDFAANFTTTMTAAEVVTKISEFESKGLRIDAVADVFYSVLGNYDNYVNGDNLYIYTTMTEGAGAVYTASVADGYYLIKDRETTQSQEGEYYTKALLAVPEDTSITVKGSAITVDKTVSDKVDNGYEKKKELAMSKAYYYKWEGKLPENIGDFDTYYYQFIDTLPEGIALVDENLNPVTSANLNAAIVSVEVVSKSSGSEEVRISMHQKDDTHPDGYVLTWDGSTGIFTLTFADLMKAYQHDTSSVSKLLASDLIVVKYRTKIVSEAALTVEGYENDVKIRFSNEPNGDGIGETIPSDSIVFTYGLNVVKVDSKDATKYLAGAEFDLYHEITLAGGAIEKEYAILKKGAADSAGRLVYEITGWTTTPAADRVKLVSTDTAAGVLIKGLDADVNYYLHETKAPVGYNLPFNATKLMIDADITEVTEGGVKKLKVTDLDYYLNDVLTEGPATVTEPVISLNITNGAGATLPSTGGVGTTMFYVAGGIMVAVAVILLITKKRMAEEQ